MSIDIKDSIGVSDNLLTEEMCNKLIKYFDKKKKFNQVYSRLLSEGASDLNKKDEAISLCEYSMPEWEKEFNPIFINFNQAWLFYRKQTGIDELYKKGFIFDLPKIQKTEPGGGYHTWHLEHNCFLRSVTRVMFFIIYLNDNYEGGETEFLNLKRRVNPKTGRIVLAPAHFPYVHRGNPPFNGTKYIITGWIHCKI
tara:strand:+ start:4454 stop:5041 length:588 start_codon:yes stop_codon:yes gene_type:complete